MHLTIFTDGGALNNPGPAASAFAIYDKSKLICSWSKKIGNTTNNVAEYTALISALEKTKELKKEPSSFLIERVVVYSDSELMVKQLNGFYKVKNSAMRDLVMRVRILEGELKIPVSYNNIPREENSFVDSLVKKELYS